MHWLTIVLAGHLLTAISFVLSKVLLSKDLNNPYVFTFYIGILGLVAMTLLPFGVVMPNTAELLIDLAGGAAFTAGLIAFFLALQSGETSRVIPIIGAGIPIFTLLIEWLFVNTLFSGSQLWAFAILVLGSVVIGIDRSSHQNGPITKTRYGIAILAAVLFAVSFGLTKFAYNSQPFISAFVWMRLGTFIAVLPIILSVHHRREIWQSLHMFKDKSGLLYLGSQAFGGIGFVLINYAITLTSVAIVNALQGVQYVFLLLLAIIGSIKYPQLLQENLSRSSLLFKISGVIIISLGIILIAQSTLIS